MILQEGVGDTPYSFAYDGNRVKKWNVKTEKYGEVSYTPHRFYYSSAVDFMCCGYKLYHQVHIQNYNFTTYLCDIKSMLETVHMTLYLRLEG